MIEKTGDTDLVELAPAGPRDFLHIYNVGDTEVFISYDGLDATVALGVPMQPGGNIQLNNDGAKPIFTRRVTAIGQATWLLRIQGV